jgi:KaiC/GvpD/RAD55 family RecA-like ATPase
MIKKIKTGIFGLNELMDGGLNEHSATAIIGPSGAGKTTFAIQFIRRGLERGQEGVFITMDENQEQIIREAVSMGWTSIREYLDAGSLVFIDASAKEFTNFVRQELPVLVEEWKGFNARIVVDPLTPVMWTIHDDYSRREHVSLLLAALCKVGTVVCTLEEHGGKGDLSGSETTIPMYIADTVIHLRHNLLGPKPDRTLKIIKFRGSRHDESAHPYKIIKGIGIVVQPTSELGLKDRAIPEKIITRIKKKAEELPADVRERITKAIDELSHADLKDLDPDRFIKSIIDEYK